MAGTVPVIASRTVPPLILRTTSDRAGHPHGVIVDTGSSAAVALLGLETAALEILGLQVTSGEDGAGRLAFFRT